MTPTLRLRALVPAGLLAVATLVAAGCGGTFTSGNSSEPVKPGDSCAANGSKAPAVDGCNTCTCGNGAWSCTEIACAVDGGQPNECEPGAQRNDGCNSCSCNRGVWACTDMDCTPHPPAVCAEGETKFDGCNRCTCSGGAWGCTRMACPPPPQCKDGDSSFDGCNTCTCSGGFWACTNRACPPSMDAGVAKVCGGKIGLKCADSEFCAYGEGHGCGANDATSTCEPRPQACDTVYDPVCGCDYKPYANPCEAAMVGIGVLNKGTCNAF